MRILVVDDDEAIRITLEETLISEGYEVYVATDGQHALDLLDKDQPPDLIITDLAMHPLDGRRLIFQLKQNSFFKNIPVMVVTGENDTKDIIDCLVIKKPFNVDVLLAKVREVLGF